VVHLGHALKELIKWLCAILAQGPGLLVKGRLPPWTAYYNRDIRFIIVTTRQFKEFGNEKPPSSAAAVELLIEFCQLYSFGS
jgi:hypothetical protein